MSFADSPRLELGDAPARSNAPLRRDDDGTYRDDPEYDSLIASIARKLSTLTTNITSLSRQVSLLGTKRETERVRERVQDLIEETRDGFKDVGERLKKAGQWPDLNPHQKYTQGKLSADFRASLGEFQLLSRRTLEKQRESKAALEQEGGSAATGADSRHTIRGGNEVGGQQQQANQQLVEAPRLASQSDVDFQESLIIERESEIRQIEQSVGELNELFRDVATMVHDQGTMVDSIEQNVQGVAEDTRGADRELRSASTYQKRARSKACCLLLILAVVLVVVVLAGVYG
ncbi:MAG: hypothetical protein Q9162_001884 [Coniocarpon cinnabarinum]